MKQNLFSPKEVDLGQLKVGQTTKIVFQSEDSAPPVRSVTASCGCSKPVHKDGVITVTYRPQPIPAHLKEQGSYIATKFITVLYKGREQERLSFKAKVVA